MQIRSVSKLDEFALLSAAAGFLGNGLSTGIRFDPLSTRLYSLGQRQRWRESSRQPSIANQSELADLGRITTARMTQIMWLLNLAPDIQKHILFLPRTQAGRDAIKETDVCPIAQRLVWRKQRRMWASLKCMN